jgi:hypothetical protein
MANTNIRLLARKIELLDDEAQRAVELAVDSLLDDPGAASNAVRNDRIATLERRVDALGKDHDDIVILSELDSELPELKSAIEHLLDAAHHALGALVPPVNVVPEAL